MKASSLTSMAGRDEFHRVPISKRKVRDAVEGVPTGGSQSAVLRYGRVTLCATIWGSCVLSAAASISLETAPPVVVQTDPVAGSAHVNPGLHELRVTFSKPMQDRSWSWSTWGEENFPETTGQPSYLPDGRTCVLPVKLKPGKFYATWLNSYQFKNFKDADGRPAVPYLLTFTTAPSTTPSAPAPLPKAEELPGQLKLHGRYQHRSRGQDIETPSELWVKESADGTLNVLAHLPFSQSSELATGNAKNALTGYRIEHKPSGDRPGYGIDLRLSDGMAQLTRRGVRENVDDRALKVPEGAWFDPNTRPDPYCAANILLRAFALSPGETKELRMYDWDNSGEVLVDYTIQISHAGKERVEVQAGAFEANHLILKQLTSANTWFKKRAGHITEFWVLDNHIIVRVLRHREPYEMMLLDYTFPEKLDGALGARTFVRVVLDGDRMTFEGQDVSWESLGDRLKSVPEPASTVLEWAIPSTQITIQEQNEWTHRFMKLARDYGFEYSSYVGVQPFDSSGAQSAVREVAAQFAGAIQARNNERLRALSTDAVVSGWVDAVTHFGDELRVALNEDGVSFEPLGRIEEVLVEGDLAAVKTAHLSEKKAYLALFFCRTPEGWRNCALQNSRESKSLQQNFKEFADREDAVEKLRRETPR